MTREDALLTQSYWPADKTRDVLPISIGEALRGAAAAAPDRIALVEVVPEGMPSLTGASRTDRRWTYQQLLADAENCAHWLLSHFEPGEHVCLWAPNVPEWILIQYGAALAGLVLVTANPALREEELRYVLQQSGSVGLIHVSGFRGTDMAAIARGAAQDVRYTFCLDDWQREVAGQARSGTLPVVAPGAPAQIQFTSGTTGRPKGALLHHMGLMTNASFVSARAGLYKGVKVSPLPLFHTAGSAISVLGCLATLSTLVLPQMFDPPTILAAVQRERAQVLAGVPTMHIALLEYLRAHPYDVSSLRVAMSGGAPVPPELLRRIEAGLGCDLLTVYGQTELSPIVCQTAPDDSAADKANTAGRPLWQVDVRIADPAGGDILPIGVEGEVQAKGYQRMLEYFGMPAATAETITADGWLRTGDLGTMDRRGYVRITGRLKDMIIRGGENIYPAEVEARLLEHPSVSDAAVFGLSDPAWGEVVAAAIRLRDGAAAPSAASLREHCRATLSPQKAPEAWFMCAAFPLTGSGKIQKFRLRESAAAGELSPIA